jgi:hypothetical protein
LISRLLLAWLHPLASRPASGRHAEFPASGSLPTRAFRERTDLDQLKRQAKDLLEAFRRGDAAAIKEVNAHYRGADTATFALHDTQLVLARAYGFESWPKLKAYVDGVTVKRLLLAVRASDLEEALRPHCELRHRHNRSSESPYCGPRRNLPSTARHLGFGRIPATSWAPVMVVT